MLEMLLLEMPLLEMLFKLDVDTLLFAMLFEMLELFFAVLALQLALLLLELFFAVLALQLVLLFELLCAALELELVEFLVGGVVVDHDLVWGAVVGSWRNFWRNFERFSELKSVKEVGVNDSALPLSFLLFV